MNQGRPRVAPFAGPILQLEYAPGACGGAQAAAYAAGPDDGLAALGVLLHVDAHLAHVGAVAAADALPAVGADAKAGEVLLQQAQVGRHGAAKAAPNAAAEDRVEAHPDDARKQRSNQKAVPLSRYVAYLAQEIIAPGIVHPQQGGDENNSAENGVNEPHL